ncbi:hypothetical protein [Chitinophaga sp.]|uniref:hypothetical protein n=1 Tax=Chitinophaga sp. TaxID=1869181 RepID=UPI0031DF1A6E
MKHLLLLFSLCSLVWGQPAHACRCISLPVLDSISQLNKYSFIAHVSVTDAGDRGSAHTGTVQFKIIELFKGDRIDSIFESDKMSSCDIGISDQEEWILFGIMHNGKLLLQPCDRNIRYKNQQGERDWQFLRGIGDLQKLRSLYRHTVQQHPDGSHTVYYPSGKKELEEHYLSGQLHGSRKIWHANGQLYASEHYLHGKLDGKSEWFYPSGQLSFESYYRAGKKYNVSRYYYDTTLSDRQRRMLIDVVYKTADSLNSEYSRIQVHLENIYDQEGTPVITREYYRLGRIKSEWVNDKDSSIKININYYPNGLINYISRFRESRTVGQYQEFNVDGTLRRWGEYDENGRLKWAE